MKILHILRNLPVILFCFIAYDDLAQEQHSFFSPDGNTVMISSNDYNPDTQIWSIGYVIYKKTPDSTQLIENGTYNGVKEHHVTDSLEILKEKHNTIVDGVKGTRTQIEGLQLDYEIVKCTKVNTLDYMHARKYHISYSISHRGHPISEDLTLYYTAGKQDQKALIKEQHLFAISVWKHPNLDQSFLSFSVSVQELGQELGRYTYVQHKQKNKINLFL